METIGQRLFNLRKKLNYTQEDMADLMAVSRQTISNWELDKNLPDTEKLFALAELYHVSLDELVYGKRITDDKKPDSEDKVFASAECTEVPEDKNTGRLVIAAQITGLVINSILLIIAAAFLMGLTSRFASDSELMNSEIVYIDRIIEQYSYAEVSKLDPKGNYAKDRLWLDAKNLSEGDAIFGYTNPGEPKKMKFEYYSRTLEVPLIVVFALFILELIFVISIIMGSKKCRIRRDLIWKKEKTKSAENQRSDA